MAQFSIVPYSIRVTRRGEFLSLDNFNNINIREQFIRFITAIHAEILKNTERMTAIDCKRLCTIHPRDDVNKDYLACIIRVGRLGEETDIVDLTTRVTTDVLNMEKASMSNFFACLEIPSNNRDEAILILQTYKTYGIKTVLENEWKRFFARENRGYALHFGHLTPAGFLEAAVARSRITEVRIRKSNPGRNQDVNALSGGHSESVRQVEFSIKSFGNQSLPIVADVLGWMRRGRRIPNQIVELSDSLGGINFDEFIVELDDQGISRTLKIGEIETSMEQIKIGLGDNVAINRQSGLPVFESIATFAVNNAISFRNAMNLGDIRIDDNDRGQMSTDQTLTYDQNIIARV